MVRISTIGYEGVAVEDLIATLTSAGIQTLLDVRQIAASRRRGFSKTALACALEKVGIEYIHLKGLGDPKPGREAARAGLMDDFRQIFTAHMATDTAKNDLERAVVLVQQGDACLFCYERSPLDCHRLLVAKAISDILPIEVRHLGVKSGRNRDGWGGAGRSSDTCQSPPSNG